MLGRRIGSWILEEELGRGGMGEVYRARHATLGTSSAVKVLTSGLETEEDFRQRFEREAGTQARLRHPNIAQVLDYLEHEGRWFLVIEFLGHGSLGDRLADTDDPVSVSQAVAWMRQTLSGLGHAHKNGVVHRDVKPANLLLNEHGQAVVTDFGIAKSEAHTKMTTTGVSVGTPQYMSPEQVETPNDVDHRSDVYSAGVVLYELLAGRVPFEADSAFAVLHAHIHQQPPSIRQVNPQVPEALERVVLKALAKKPDQRFQSCREMEEALEAVARGEDPRVTPPPPPEPSQPRPSTGAAPTMLETPSGRQATVVDTRSSPPATVSASNPRVPVPVGPQGMVQDLGRRRKLRQRALVAVLGALLVGAAVGAYLLFGAGGEVEMIELRGPEIPSLSGGLPAEAPEGLLAQVEAQRQAAAEAARKVQAAAQRADRAAGEADGASREARASRDTNQALEAAKAASNAASSSRNAAREAGEGASEAWKAASEAGQAAASVGSSEDDRPEWAMRLEETTEAARRSAESAQASAERAEASAKRAAESAEKAHRAVEDLRAKLLRRHPGVPPGGVPPLPGGPLPEQPVTAVLVQGDPVLAAPLEAQLEQRLLRAGFDVRDEHGSLEASKMLRDQGSDVDPQALGQALVREGFHVLVTARVEVGERREVAIRRQTGSMTFARIRMNSRLLLTGRPLGRGWTEQVEYTELSAQPKAEQALVGETVDLIDAVRKGWTGYRDQVAQAGRAAGSGGGR